MNMQLITNDMLVERYGSTHDGIRVFGSNGKPIGYLTDLRVAYSRDVKANKKQKEYNNKIAEARRDAMPEAVEQMKDYLKSQLVKYDAEVFINISQPNVHLNGCKCYITVDSLNDKSHRLGIMHPTLSVNDMSDMIQGFKVSNGTSDNHILWNNLSADDIIDTIKRVCL
ncbi:hypothetical protein fHeYen901_246 [Yersinia phage fHe-Yen9-01]|uniref:Inhibitor of host transcription n=1 Tax=Yersinia phage fHe-Yen9-01 TaxID=1965363 RepID=A0A1V0DXY9_9CAUD|nr:inhibitor of host transcription [Yersinia phage fHe-Yen9-01]ARB06019.1 hypothetical protein fHeYen901_246 [Yersinia phage fHe-Yen9-01]